MSYTDLPAVILAKVAAGLEEELHDAERRAAFYSRVAGRLREELAELKRRIASETEREGARHPAAGR